MAPPLAGIQAWLSGTGASVALADLAGTGLPSEVCLVDPRTDTITVSPAPSTGVRFDPFVLTAGPLPYDRRTMAPAGCLPGDFNQDGRTDLLTYYWGRTPILFLRLPNPLSARSFVAQEVVPTLERWYTNAVTAADVDGDGRPDLVVGNYFPDGSRLLDPTAVTDPAFEMNDSMSRAFNGGRNRLLRWSAATSGADPGVTFEEVPDAFPPDLARAWTLAIGAYDLTGNLLPDLYFANDFGPSRLLRNDSEPGVVRLAEVRGAGGFAVPRSKALGNDSFKGMGVDFGDLTGSGYPDIFVSNITAPWGLMESNFAWVNTGEPMTAGRAPFRDRSERLGLARSGWGWDAKIADLDNDGGPEILQAVGFVAGQTDIWPQVAELAMSNDRLLRDPRIWMRHTPGWDLAGDQHLVLFAAGRDGRYADIAALVGLGAGPPTRALSTADIDGDGRLDVAAASQWGESYLYLNRSATAGAALDLRLLLPVPGEVPDQPLHLRGEAGDAEVGVPAVGATAIVTLPAGRELTAQVDGGNGHASARSKTLHFGLGEIAAHETLPVRVAWRDLSGAVHQLELELTPGRWTVVLPGGSS